MIKGIDCATKLNAKTAAAIKAAGYEFAGRYLVPKSYTKALSASEAKAITGAGLRLLTVWETTANRISKGGDAGYSDGTKAKACAQEIGMPTTGIIYFACDYDADQKAFDAIEQYLRMAATACAPYQIGIYGSYRVVEAMHKRNAASAYWQCIAWSAGKKADCRNVYQAQWNQTVCGVNVDINECSDMDKAGIWTYEKAAAVPAAENKKEEDEIVTYSDFKNFMTQYEAEKAAAAGDDWAQVAMDKAVNAGIYQGDGKGNLMPMSYVTREQLAVILARVKVI